MNQTTDWSSTAKSTADSVSNGDVPNAAAKVSNTMEESFSQEPTNSTMRSVLMVSAAASILGSLILQLARKKDESLFVGQWAPTILLIALWTQMVKEQR
ncbi:MAG: hypothetical protein M3160_00625 [Candidatus Eremiobacteraeota bacterium]|nr:hypothetical protein [Candidatus Eremiobacteraeota bacterium]